MVAHCRGSPTRQALVPHLVLFSSCQGHGGHDDDNVNGGVMTITMRMMVMTKKVGRMKPMMSKTMVMIIHDKH